MALGNTLFLFNPDNGPWADTETYVDEASGFSLAANSDSQIGQDFALTNYPGVGSGAVYVESNKDRHYATSPDSSLLPSAGKTYKLVIRRDDDGDACAMWVISDGTGNDGIRIGFTGSNRIRVYVFSGGVEYSVDTTVDTTVTSGEDAHIVITIPDPIGTPSIYLNGSSVSTSSFTATLTDGNALAIGSRATGSHSQGFDGAVYQAAVYDGAATSDEVLNNLYLGDRDASRSDSNPYTIFEAYRGIGYYSDSLLSRVPGTQENGVVDLGNLSGTIDRGSTDNILMPACRVNNLNFTLLGRLAVQGSGESDLLADISGTGTIDANGYGALPSALSPYSGNSNHTALRCSVLIDGITLTDSVSPAGNMFTHQALISDSPTVCLLHGVTATNADLDCISGKASGSMVGESASNTRMLLIGCNASNPGTASNNQAYTLHNGYHGYGWDNTFSGNTGGSDVAVSHVNDGTKDCQYNLTSFGSVGGITEWYGGVSDLRGISGAIDWNESYDADTVWQDLFVSNWGSGTSDHAIRLSHSGSSSEHTLRRILFDGGGSLFRTNATSIGTYLIDSSATVFGKTDTDRVLIDAGSSITLRLTNNAFRCSDYSVDDDGGITVSEDSGNVYESQGNGYTHPTPANTIGIPSESQVNATNAGNVSYDSPTGPLSAMRESVLKILSVSTGDGMLSLLSPKKEGAIADPVWPSIFGAIKTPIH